MTYEAAVAMFELFDAFELDLALRERVAYITPYLLWFLGCGVGAPGG